MKLFDSKNTLGMERLTYYPRCVRSVLFDPVLSSGVAYVGVLAQRLGSSIQSIGFEE